MGEDEGDFRTYNAHPAGDQYHLKLMRFFHSQTARAIIKIKNQIEGDDGDTLNWSGIPVSDETFKQVSAVLKRHIFQPPPKKDRWKFIDNDNF
jgi:hypothetical protein